MSDRRNLLLDEASSQSEISPEEERRLKRVADDGGIFLTLVNSPGWKKLMEDFINVRLDQNRYLEGKVEDLADIRAAQRELIDLLRFVKNAIGEGEKAYKTLKNGK